jgi:hypothetical protein
MGRRSGTIGFSHVGIALAASGLTYVAVVHPNWFGMLAAVCAIPVAMWLFLSIGLALLDKLFCPACGARSLRRQSINPFGFRYFRCKECGARCKRRMLGGWFDASGRRDARVYESASPADPWGNGPVAPEVETATGTHAVLLQNKRHRKPLSDDPFEE